jgi:hypothetical protein
VLTLAAPTIGRKSRPALALPDLIRNRSSCFCSVLLRTPCAAFAMIAATDFGFDT